MTQTMPFGGALSTSGGQPTQATAPEVTFGNTVPVSPVSGNPQHYNETASRMVVYRSGLVDKDGREQARKPLFSLPENINPDRYGAERDIHYAAKWWGGVEIPLDTARMIVSGDWDEETRRAMRDGAFGPFPGAPKDIAHLPALDDQFVIDCDTKVYYDSPDGSAWVTNGNTARMAKTYTKFGLDDLYREAEQWGMVREELDDYLDTWTEGTKSGGCHIVFRQNPELRITGTMHHKHEYRVDVITSKNNWRACYPSPGYTVLRDRPVREAPLRLVELLIHLDETLDPVGGKRMIKAAEGFKAADRRAYAIRNGGQRVPIQNPALMNRWREGVLRVIHEANRSGEWNNKIYWAAHRYREGGWPIETAERDILSAAQPWDAREERKATDTIRSAYRGDAR